MNKKLNDLITLGEDTLRSAKETGILYLEKFLDCPGVYAGCTKREHRVRHAEHVNIKNKKSKISLHIYGLKHNFDEGRFTVLDREKSWFKDRESESLHKVF